jgi:hypothetical protein
MSEPQKWLILKSENGPYLNSPCYYVEAGTIDDADPENAAIRAMFLVGSSRVKIVPLYEFIDED